MPTEVEIPDIGIVEFPDELDEAGITSEIQKLTGNRSRENAPNLATLFTQSPLDVQYQPGFPSGIPPIAGEPSRESDAAAMKEGVLSTLGITPDIIPSGRGILDAIGPAPRALMAATSGINIPEPAAVIGSSAAKTALGVADYMSSPQGVTELVLSLTPARLAVMAEWAASMAKGAGEEVGTLVELLRKPNKTPEDFQEMSDRTISALAMVLGSGATAFKARGEIGKIADKLNMPVGKIPVESRFDTAQEIENRFRANRAVEAGSPFTLAEPPPQLTLPPGVQGPPAAFPVSMGVRTQPPLSIAFDPQGRVIAETFDPSGLRLGQPEAQAAPPPAPQVRQMRPIAPGMGEEILAPTIENVRAQRELEARQKGQDAIQPESTTVPRDVQQQQVTPEGAREVPKPEGGAQATEAQVNHTLESDKILYKDISDRILQLVRSGNGFSPLMEVLKNELEIVKNRHDGMPPGQTSPARKTMQAQQEKMKADAANELQPAVRIGGRVISDPNKGHIQMALEIGGPDALADVSNPANQGFVYRGEFISRDAASGLLGEKTPLTSERLRELRDNKKESPSPEPEVESVTPLDPATGSALSATDSLINRLESLKFPETGEGRLYSLPHPDAVRQIGKQLWNDTVDLTIAAIKAGKAIGQAIDDAVSFLKTKSTNFDEAKFRRNIQFVASAEQARIAAAPPTGQAPPAPPTPPAATPTPGSPAPSAPRGTTLDDVYKRFESEPKKGPGISVSRIVEAVRTGLASKFRPIDKLAQDIAKAYGVTTPRGISGIFEQLKGSTGKAEADIYRFDREVSRWVKGSERDFNAYMFLRRSLDRLRQDLADIQKAQAGGEVKNLNRRQVSSYTIPELEAKLSLLESKLGREKLGQFETAAKRYQDHMDQSLRLQVESGRMSPEVYDAIKAGNEFYAPFKVMKYFEEIARPEGTGRKIDTVAEFTKAMEGIEDPNFRLGDMLGAARQNIMLSRILAEKNNAMRRLAQLSEFDVDGRFIRKLKPNQEVASDATVVNVKEGGKTERYQVNKDVYDAVNAYKGISDTFIAQLLGLFAVPMKAGATAWNIPFQISNLMADVPRQALVSKFGVKSPIDLVRYPLDIVSALYSSIMGDVFKRDNKLFLDFLDSGAAGTTFQEFLTPSALRFKPSTMEKSLKSFGKSVLHTLPDVAKAIEQISKIVGVKRAMRETGARSGTELARQFPEAVTEIRRFSGSPDFGRQGRWVEQAGLNLLYMFFNARLQGAIADIGRLGGRDGAGVAAKTWLKLAAAVGIPTYYLYAMNNGDPELKAEYKKRPLQERQNYWLIPKGDYITNEQGEKMMDYWRIPKRESSKWIANMLESSMEFAEKRDAEQFGRWVEGALVDISPLNVTGENLQERLESSAASLNPMLKAPLEIATGRDLYRHREIVPESMQKASPELQYTERTPEVFKTLADKMPDVAPEVFRSPLMLENLTRNLTAGLFTQFLPRRPVEGREGIENAALLQRFQSVPYTDSAEFDQRMKLLEREAADTQLTRFRNAKEIMDSNKGKSLKDMVSSSNDKYGADVKLIQRIVDMYVAEQRGITTQERRIIALPVQQRATFLADEFRGLNKQQKEQLIRNYANKRILTEDVAVELTKLLEGQ